MKRFIKYFMSKFTIFAIGCVFMLPVFAQSTLPKQPSYDTQMGMLAAANQQKPFIGDGMRIISIEDGYHVLMGGNGRYVIKGSFWDLWDGVIESKITRQAYKQLPDSLDNAGYFVDFGTPGKEQVYVYVKYGCVMCAQSLSILNQPDLLSNYHVRVMVLSNDETSKIVAHSIYCADDPQLALRSTFIDNKPMPSNDSCNKLHASQAVQLAYSQNVKALPATFFAQRGLMSLGDPIELYQSSISD